MNRNFKSISQFFLLAACSFSLMGCKFFINGKNKENIESDAIVNPLKESNNYHCDEFERVFLEFPKNVYAPYELKYDEYSNFMPNNIYDKYGIGAHRVRTSGGELDFYDYYLMYDGKIYNISRIGANKEAEHYISQFLFTDYNDDGCVEITVSYFYKNYSTLRYVSSFDTKTKMFVTNSHAGFEELAGPLVFKEVDDGYGIFEEDGTLYSKIVKYERSFKLNEELYTLTSDNYRVNITYDKYLTEFPFIYEGIRLYFKVNVSMKYLGETFSYTNGNTYLDGALTTFYHGDKVLEMEWWSAGMAMTDFTVYKNQVIDRTYNYFDTYYEGFGFNNVVGTYDMKVSYRGEVIWEMSSLTLE